MRYLTGLLIALLLGFFTAAGPARAKPGNSGQLLEYTRLPVAGLPDQRLTIWLPPGYNASRRRYPVVYMQDGHNLFDPAKSNFNKIWAADKAMVAAAKKGGFAPHIIVGIWAPGKDRWRQYLPKDIYLSASGDTRAQMDMLSNGPVVSDIYIDWMAGPLKLWVDSNFRTLPDRSHTSVMGSSMGGLVSCYAFLKHPEIYGQAACVSTHWPASNPQTTNGVNPDLINLWSRWFSSQLGKANGRKLWFDHGTATLDAYYAPYQQSVDAAMTASGWSRGEDWESRVYSDAAHEENAWAARLPEIFEWLYATRIRKQTHH